MRFAPLVLAILCVASPVVGDEAPDAPAAPPAGRIAALVPVASAEVNTPERRDARDALFRQVVPWLRESGPAPTAADAAAIASAAQELACATGRVRVVEARVEGDLAWVAAGGSRGGCTWLLRREGDRFVALMPLGWSLGE